MTGRRAAAIATAALCLAAATLLALLASDVGAWQQAFRSGDLAAASDPRATPGWRAEETLPFGLAQDLLGVDDDLAFRRAVTLFRRAAAPVRTPSEAAAAAELRVQAEARLARAARDREDRGRASAAANLLGVLALLDATSGATGSATPVERSIFEFQDAIRLDADNEQAKANLELVYQITSGPVPLQGRAGRTGAPRGGATAAAAGQGY